MSGLERIMRAAIERGETDERIAAALNVSASMVRWYRVRWGYPPSRAANHRKPPVCWNGELRERVNDMRMRGERPERIAAECGISRRTVYRLLRRELKDGTIRVYSAATRQRLADHMRRIQPLGAAASRKTMFRHVRKSVEEIENEKAMAGVDCDCSGGACG